MPDEVMGVDWGAGFDSGVVSNGTIPDLVTSSPTNTPVNYQNPKKVNLVSQKNPTADDYYSVYPTDRRSREEINSLLEKNIKLMIKLLHNNLSSKFFTPERRRALFVAVHFGFEEEYEKLGE